MMKQIIRHAMVSVFLAGLLACGGGEPGQEPGERNALQINRKAAEKGDADAQFALAMIYENGRGVEQNSRKAMEWLEKAARQNHVEAQYLLARMYSYGMDMVKAYAWFELAARTGDKAAREQLRVLDERLPATTLEQALALAETWAEDMED